jgi:GT2 family glycosyltransferase
VSEPIFTVAMPAYNSERTIASAIGSVLAQTQPDFELIVVDDGSSDATVDVARGFQDSRVRVRRQENAGPGAARNLAIVEGRGRYISMLDSDDLWLPAYLETMGAALDADPKAGLAYTDAWVLDDATGRIRRTTAMHYQDPPVPPPTEPQEFLRQLLIRGNFVFTSGTVRRAALDEIGVFNMLLTPSEDFELWLRIVATGWRAVRVGANLAVYRKHSGSLSSNEVAILRGEGEALRRVVEEYDVPEELRALALRRLRRVDVRAAGLSGDRGIREAMQRLRARAVRVKIALVEPFAWHDRPPPEVEAVLANANRQDAGANARSAVDGDGPQAQNARSEA